ncbi:MAG: NADH-quinone oxidoreductase subunit NuoG [Pseudomonadales bacterium]
MATIFVDGVEYEAEPGQNLLHACLSQGLELPYFCWHPSLGSVGACRQCAVVQYQDENDTRGHLTMACMTPATDGARISIAAPYAQDFRASVIEWLMENHPHDCPVCEEGGECHLQDMTVVTGHTSRRYRGTKRTFENQYLGPLVNHEMNRCITCYRCVRYYGDYAGGKDLQAFGSQARMYFGRSEDGVLESPFAGNLVEVCPTGVFTDKPFSKTYTRKWDLQSAPSVCAGCAVGCNTFPGERYGRLKRLHNRYHGEVNGYFLCDRGRYGFGFVNHDRRVRQAGVRVEDDLFEAIDDEAAASQLGALIKQGSAIGIGSPRASLESNAALKSLVGADNFCTGLSTHESELVDLALDIYAAGGARIPSLSDVEAADAVIIVGEDVLNTAPRIALALRQSVRNQALDMAEDAGIPAWQIAGVQSHSQNVHNPLFIATILPTGIDDIARARLNADPERLALAGFAVANAINPAFAAADEIDVSTREFVEQASQALAAAKRPLVISGTGVRNADVIKAAANIAWALKSMGSDPALLLSPAEVNTYGAAMIKGGLELNAALSAAANGSARTLVVMENDLFRRADPGLVERALDAADSVVVLDVLETPTAEHASLVLPAATFAESTGTYVNYETRAQRFYEVFAAKDAVAPAWRWLAQAGIHAGRNDMRWEQVDQVTSAVADLAGLSGVGKVAPGAEYRGAGQTKIPRAPHRYSGRTAMNADVNIHEPKTRVDPETPFSYSMEGTNRGQPGSLVPYVWAPGWNSNQSVYKFQQEVGGALSGGDPGVRLIDDPPAQIDFAQWFRAPALLHAATDAGIRLLPVHTIFGSDELSMQSQAIGERGPVPHIVLSPADAERLGVSAGAGVRCVELDAAFEVRIDAALARGDAAICVGLSGAGSEVPEQRVELLADPDYTSPRPSDANLIARG